MTGTEAFLWIVAGGLWLTLAILALIGGIIDIRHREQPRELTADEIADRPEMFVTPLHSTPSKQGRQQNHG
jgi:hypothetical protein